MIWVLVVLIQLHGPGGQVIDINPREITSLRTPTAEEHFARGVHCIINTSDGKFSLVLEACETVFAMAKGAEE